MIIEDALSTAARLSTIVFLPLRRLAGPLHRRRRVLETDQNDHLPPLSTPWEDERWFRGGFPPRWHNALEPLLHGEEYFHDLHAALLSARERVTICGWCLTPLMPLLRGDRQGDSVLANVLREASSRAEVYVLLWGGAPALFEPTERMVKEVQRTLLRIAPRARCEVDRRAPFSHDHHQKAVTIDGRVAYVGGMDLSTFQGDRWDTHEHPLRFGPNWHDVQLRLHGEAVQDIEENFCQRWNAVTGERVEPLPQKPLESTWDTLAQVVRTVPAGFYPFAPQGEFGIHHALTSAIRKAERFIYLENQYIWAPEVARSLRVRLWAEHLGLPEEQVARANPIVLVDEEWQAAAKTMETCIRSATMPSASKVRTYVPGRNPASRLVDIIQEMMLEH